MSSSQEHITDLSGAVSGDRSMADGIVKQRVLLWRSGCGEEIGASSIDNLSRNIAAEDDLVIINWELSGNRSSISRYLVELAGLWTKTQQADLLLVQIRGSRDLLLRWFPALIAARLTHRLSVALLEFDSPIWQRPIIRWLLKHLLKQADRLVTPTEWQMGALRRVGLAPAMIPTLQPVQTFSEIIQVQPRILVEIGAAQLGEIDRIVQSFSLVKSKYPRAELVILGVRNQHAEIQNRIERTMANRLSGIEIVDVGNSGNLSGDVVICLDNDNSFPRQLVSAWQSGRVPLIPAFSLVSSIVRDGFNGLVYSAANTSGLADAVVRLVEEPSLVRAISSQGLIEARGFQWPALKSRWRAILLPRK